MSLVTPVQNVTWAKSLLSRFPSPENDISFWSNVYHDVLPGDLTFRPQINLPGDPRHNSSSGIPLASSDHRELFHHTLSFFILHSLPVPSSRMPHEKSVKKEEKKCIRKETDISKVEVVCVCVCGGWREKNEIKIGNADVVIP